jgi:hypothetical protein
MQGSFATVSTAAAWNCKYGRWSARAIQTPANFTGAGDLGNAKSTSVLSHMEVTFGGYALTTASASLQGHLTNATNLSNFNQKVVGFSLNYDFGITENSGAGDLGYRTHVATILSMGGNTFGWLTHDTPFPVDMAAATYDRSKNTGSLTFTFDTGCSIVQLITVTSEAMNRIFNTPGVGSDLDISYVSNGPPAVTWVNTFSPFPTGMILTGTTFAPSSANFAGEFYGWDVAAAERKLTGNFVLAGMTITGTYGGLCMVTYSAVSTGRYQSVWPT